MKPSFGQTMRAAWSMYWKYAIIGTLVSFTAGGLVGAIEGFIVVLLGYNAKDFELLFGASGVIAGLIAGFLVFTWILRFSLNKQFGGWTLRLERN